MAKPYPTGSVVPLGVCSSVHLFTFGAEMGLHRGVQALGYAPRPLYSRCVRFSRCGSRGLSCSTARGNLVPRSGVEPFPVLLIPDVFSLLTQISPAPGNHFRLKCNQLYQAAHGI